MSRVHLKQLDPSGAALDDVVTFDGTDWVPLPTIAVAVIFDDSVPGTNVNIRSDRAANQSPIDNTLAGITDLGSKTATYDPAATGVIGAYSTIGGGDDNSAGPTGWETVAGGAANKASGDSATVGGGYTNQAIGAQAAVLGGLNNQATNDHAAIGGGQNNLASGTESTVCGGSGNTASGNGSVCSGGGSNVASDQDAGCFAGDNNLASGEVSACLGGNSSQATGYSSIAAGYDVIASGEASFACGFNTISTGDAALVSGTSCEATVDASSAFVGGRSCTVSERAGFAHGQTCSVTARNAQAFGKFTTASAEQAHVVGLEAIASRTTQVTQGSGAYAVDGDSQTSVLVFKGTTPGVGATEAVELLYAGEQFIPTDERTYMFRVDATVIGNQGGTICARAFELTFVVMMTAGVITIEGTGPASSYGGFSAGATGDWTLVPSIGAAPDRLVLTFTTGATTTISRVTARVEFTEAAF